MRTIAVIFFLGAGWGQNRPTAVVDMNMANVANLPAQKISANDLIAVSVYDSPELTRTVRVGADGTFRFPMLKKPIVTEGLMPAQLETVLADALKADEILVDPVVTVTILEYDSRPISVLGAVRKPITFQAVGKVTIIDALAKAEGLSAEAGPEILLSKPVSLDGKTTSSLVQRIAVSSLIDSADHPELNERLTGGEEIRVPEARKIYITGNVKKPGAFPVRDGSENSVLKLIGMVEGVTQYASKEAYVYRVHGDGQPRTEITIELSKILARKSPDVPLLPDDILYIPDAKGMRAGLTALEKVLIYGSGAASALIYAGVR
jgi:polysaccharide export outer membrane protein